MVGFASNAAFVAMLFCIGMFVYCVLRIYSIGSVEKRAYIEYQLQRCRRRINWLDSRCLEYRSQEAAVEEELDKWQLLLEQENEI